MTAAQRIAAAVGEDTELVVAKVGRTATMRHHRPPHPYDVQDVDQAATTRFGRTALLHARGLFLMAPSFYMPGMEQLTSKPAACPKAIVHGWRDEVVPVENSVRFAREHWATLHVLDSDHRLHSELSLVNYLFEYFLVSLDLPKRR